MDRLVIRYRRVDELIPYVRNPRKHPDKQVAGLAAWIKRVGFRIPVLLDAKDEIIAGHGRLLAGKRLGMAEVPTIDCSDLSPEDVQAFRVADNRFAELSEWDDALLAGELAAMETGLVKVAGFTDKEVQKLLAGAMAAAAGGEASAGLADPEAAPDAPGRPVSALGDLWLCGRHRVLCGDATNAEHVGALLAGGKPHLMVTDPPYGVQYDPAWRTAPEVEASRQTAFEPGRTVATGAVRNDAQSDWRDAWSLFPGDVAYVWCASLFSPEAIGGLEAAGFERRSQLIWRKPHFALSRGHYHWQHEPCWYVVRKGASAHWHGDRKQTTVWDITSLVGWSSQTEGANARTGHGTQKPIECMLRPMRNSSRAGDTVYDPFLGSGTALIAAQMADRVCFGAEIDPTYCDIIVRRWQEFSGRSAVLSDGRTFEATGAERGALLAV
jgi:DNA modification methylase